jgi:hypothetical protein
VRGALIRRGALALALALAAPAAWGEPAQITGRVINAKGEPIAGLEVALEASRTRFDGRTLRRIPVETRRLAATAGAAGEFSIDWPGDDGFDRFEAVAGFRVRKPGGERFVELARSNLTRRLRAGSPVVAMLEVADTGLLDAVRAFLASLSTADEQRTYDELGKPDSIDIVRGPGWVETTWWYFTEGRAARFRDGVRLEVRSFDPVRAF